MIQPMLAMPQDKVQITDYTKWALEQKFDGHRLIVEVGDSPRVARAWTRPRKHAGSNGKTQERKALPEHLARALASLPPGIYDGELLGGNTSTDVTRTDLAHTLSFVVFDVLQLHGRDLMAASYDTRRRVLEQEVFNVKYSEHVILAQSMPLTGKHDVDTFFNHVRKNGGEGCMLKRREATYQAGKRSRDVVKIKALHTAVLTVIGFEPTRGKVLNRGAFATVVLEDAAGHVTSVKTKDDAELDALQREWDQRSSMTTNTDDPARLHPGGLKTPGCHPAIGRKLRIEYQDRAANGGYRHPRWDRWENE